VELLHRHPGHRQAMLCHPAHSRCRAFLPRAATTTSRTPRKQGSMSRRCTSSGSLLPCSAAAVMVTFLGVLGAGGLCCYSMDVRRQPPLLLLGRAVFRERLCGGVETAAGCS
jgi:hypothetical protein